MTDAGLQKRLEKQISLAEARWWQLFLEERALKPDELTRKTAYAAALREVEAQKLELGHQYAAALAGSAPTPMQEPGRPGGKDFARIVRSTLRSLKKQLGETNDSAAAMRSIVGGSIDTALKLADTNMHPMIAMAFSFQIENAKRFAALSKRIEAVEKPAPPIETVKEAT